MFPFFAITVGFMHLTEDAFFSYVTNTQPYSAKIGKQIKTKFGRGS
jgi:hypothetical protein